MTSPAALSLCPCSSGEPIRPDLGLCVVCGFSPTRCDLERCPECGHLNDRDIALVGTEQTWGPFDGPDMAVTLALFECQACGQKWAD